MLGYQLNKFPPLVLKYKQADHMLTLHGPLGISVYKSACFVFFSKRQIPRISSFTQLAEQGLRVHTRD